VGLLYCGPGSVVGIATGTGSTVRGSNPGGGGEIFRTFPDRPWGPPSLLYNGYRVFPGGKVRPGRATDHSPTSSGRGVALTPHPLLVPWSRKSRAIPLLPLRAVRPVQSLSALQGCTVLLLLLLLLLVEMTDCSANIHGLKTSCTSCSV